jgi:hypothetical protein
MGDFKGNELYECLGMQGADWGWLAGEGSMANRHSPASRLQPLTSDLWARVSICRLGLLGARERSIPGLLGCNRLLAWI